MEAKRKKRTASEQGRASREKGKELWQHFLRKME